MLVRTEPFRDFDRLAHQMLGATARPARMPMDAWRDGELLAVHFDLPQVDPDSVEVDIVATCSPPAPSVASQPGTAPK
jgi:HSP20 family protein